MIAFWVIWPFEVIKNLAQAEIGGKTNRERANHVLKTYGPLGFYLGILPGSMSVLCRNGSGFVAMQYI